MTTPQLAPASVAEVRALIAGDVGGQGISRFRFIRNDAGIITVADCNAAGAAVQGLYNGMKVWLPASITVTVQPLVELFDPGSALIQGGLTMTSVPGGVTGQASGGYSAGVGCRINWKTNQISGRRMLKGSTYMVPLGGNAYISNGSLNAGPVNQATTSGNAYIAAMTAANLVPVIWHRPHKGFTTGGLTGVVNALQVPTTPAGLRSRRS